MTMNDGQVAVGYDEGEPAIRLSFGGINFVFTVEQCRFLVAMLAQAVQIAEMLPMPEPSPLSGSDFQH